MQNFVFLVFSCLTIRLSGEPAQYFFACQKHFDYNGSLHLCKVMSSHFPDTHPRSFLRMKVICLTTVVLYFQISCSLFFEYIAIQSLYSSQSRLYMKLFDLSTFFSTALQLNDPSQYYSLDFSKQYPSLLDTSILGPDKILLLYQLPL